jgi:hypothetical protein
MIYSIIDETSEYLLKENIFSKFSDLEHELEDFEFFPAAFQKASNLSIKTAKFKDQDKIDTFLLCDPPNLVYGHFSHPRLGKLTKLASSDSGELSKQLAQAQRPCFVILTNNVLAKIGIREFRQITNRAENCLFIIHDYDCHHWLQMSAQCILLSDLYIPAHDTVGSMNRLLNTSHNPRIPIGSIQWDYEFLVSRIDLMCQDERPVVIKGRHSQYSRFPFRNRLIATFNQHFREICFTDTIAFHQLSQLEKFADWHDTQLHFVAPVSTDVPIRVFDALVTGGIPVIPVSMESAVSEYGLSKQNFFTYGVSEIANPVDAVSEWVEIAKKRTYEEKFELISKSISNFHIRNITKRLFTHALQLIN